MVSHIVSEGYLAIKVTFLSVSVLIFLGFSLVETPVSGSGSGIPNQRLCVFVLFELFTTWLNSTVKGSAPRLLTSRNRIEILA